MTYAEAVAHLNALVPELAASPKRRFDLQHMRRLCAALGDPQRAFPAVLIAGTNGKGSTAATLASILTAAGLRTALYTSPHLSRVNERIQLAHPILPSEYGASIHAGAAPGADGELTLGPIPDGDFASLYTLVDQAGRDLVHSGDLPLEPSFFERITALAFLYFARHEAEIAVLEVGLGGRLDATNVVEPILSILTDIALDHQEYLGNTLAEIAREKCGILRPHGTLITLAQHPEANQAIGEAATALDVHALDAARYIPPAARAPAPFTTAAAAPRATLQYHPHQGVPSPATPQFTPAAGLEITRNRYPLILTGGDTLQVDSPLPGQHQQRNLALAIAAALELRSPSNPYHPEQQPFTLPDSALERGLRQTRWPGRLERIGDQLLLDVAHNPAGAWTLRAFLAAMPPERPRTLIFSCLRDKSLTEMARILFPLFDSSAGSPRPHDHILLAPIASPRTAAVSDLLTTAHDLGVPAHAAPHLAGALAQALQITPTGGLIVATGSVYLVGELRQLALEYANTASAASRGVPR